MSNAPGPRGTVLRKCRQVLPRMLPCVTAVFEIQEAVPRAGQGPGFTATTAGAGTPHAALSGGVYVSRGSLTSTLVSLRIMWLPGIHAAGMVGVFIGVLVGACVAV